MLGAIAFEAAVLQNRNHIEYMRKKTKKNRKRKFILGKYIVCRKIKLQFKQVHHNATKKKNNPKHHKQKIGFYSSECKTKVATRIGQST